MSDGGRDERGGVLVDAGGRQPRGRRPALGMCLDSFERFAQPEVRLIRKGRLRLVPVTELQQWAEQNAERTLGTTTDEGGRRDHDKRKPARPGFHQTGGRLHRQLAAVQVDAGAARPGPGVLAEYGDHLPLTVRQIFYRLVAAHGYAKSERGYASCARPSSGPAGRGGSRSTTSATTASSRSRWTGSVLRPGTSGTTPDGAPTTTAATARPASPAASSCGAKGRAWPPSSPASPTSSPCRLLRRRLREPHRRPPDRRPRTRPATRRRCCSTSATSTPRAKSIFESMLADARAFLDEDRITMIERHGQPGCGSRSPPARSSSTSCRWTRSRRRTRVR